MDKNFKKPHIQVKPPGPKTQELLKRTGDPLDPFPPIWGIPAVKTEGPWIKDVDGNVFLDFVSGKCVCNIGHRHPEVVTALKNQIDHVVLGATANRFVLAEKLIQLTPGSFEKTVFFGSAGSDSIDGALKLARWSSRRPNILCVAGAYHGQTYGALSVSSTWPWMVRGFHASSGVFHMPAPYCYRCPLKLEYPNCELQCVRYVEENMFTTYCPPEDVAAIIVEPVFGDMGWVLPSDEYFIELKRICDAYDILFIVDEVQTGFGRTGKWFAIEHMGIEPDMICLGKPIASGIPLSAMVARKDLTFSSKWEFEEHFHQSFTIEANALGCAASLATLRVIEREKLVDNSAKLGLYVMKRLEEFKESYMIVGDVRGRGLLCTTEIVRDRETKEPAPKESRKICRYALENGLYTMFMGAFSATSIRIAPPLNSTPEIIDLGLDILEKAFAKTEQEM